MRIYCLNWTDRQKNQTRHFSTFQWQLWWRKFAHQDLEGEGRQETGPWSFSNLEFRTGSLGIQPDAEFGQWYHEDHWFHTLLVTWPCLRIQKVVISHLVEEFSATAPLSPASFSFQVCCDGDKFPHFWFNSAESVSFFPFFSDICNIVDTTFNHENRLLCCLLLQPVPGSFKLLKRNRRDIQLWPHLCIFGCDCESLQFSDWKSRLSAHLLFIKGTSRQTSATPYKLRRVSEIHLPKTFQFQAQKLASIWVCSKSKAFHHFWLSMSLQNFSLEKLALSKNVVLCFILFASLLATFEILQIQAIVAHKQSPRW